jgi:hypothetical protein
MRFQVVSLLLAVSIVSIKFGIDINHYERWCFTEFIGMDGIT